MRHHSWPQRWCIKRRIEALCRTHSKWYRSISLMFIQSDDGSRGSESNQGRLGALSQSRAAKCSWRVSWTVGRSNWSRRRSRRRGWNGWLRGSNKRPEYIWSGRQLVRARLKVVTIGDKLVCRHGVRNDDSEENRISVGGWCKSTLYTRYVIQPHCRLASGDLQ